MNDEREVYPCRFSEFAEHGGRTGAHDFTDSYSPVGQPEFLYCRRCGWVIPREPPVVVTPTIEPLPPANPSLMGSR